MAASKYHFWYRHPKTTQERKLYDRDKKYVRAKRGKRRLPEAYDDIRIGKNYNSWKNRRKTQYRENKGENWGRHVIVLKDGHGRFWDVYNNITDHLEKMGYYYESDFKCRRNVKIIYYGNPI